MDDMTRLNITSDLAPTVEDLCVIRAGLMAFNDSCAGPAQVERVAVYLRDENGVIQGGAVGYMAWQWLTVEWLWVTEELRGHGHGSALDTYEFQARPFYEKHGYEVFGVLEGYPANTRTYYLQKAI